MCSHHCTVHCTVHIGGVQSTTYILYKHFDGTDPYGQAIMTCYILKFRWTRISNVMWCIQWFNLLWDVLYVKIRSNVSRVQRDAIWLLIRLRASLHCYNPKLLPGVRWDLTPSPRCQCSIAIRNISPEQLRLVLKSTISKIACWK